MPNLRYLLPKLAVPWLLIFSLPATAQVVTATLPVGVNPASAAVNSSTNTVFVVNDLCNTYPCANPGTVTVIDGATNNVKATVNVGISPEAIAVNSATNKIYVTNLCGDDSTCQSPGTVTVIDGTTYATQTVTVGYVPDSVAVNPVTNTIYVANSCLGSGFPNNCSVCDTGISGIVTMINGSNLTTQNALLACASEAVAVNTSTNMIYATSLFDPNGQTGMVTAINGTTLATQGVPVGGYSTIGIAVNSVTNQIYATSYCGDPTCQTAGTMTAINGTNLNTQTVTVGFRPLLVAVNPATNKIYVANACADGTCENFDPSITVLNGSTLSATTFPVCGVGAGAADLEINTSTNQIYFPCDQNGGVVDAIDGSTNAITPIAVGDEPAAAAVNALTNTIYVPNFADNTVSVVGGATKLQLTAVTPCRLIDTRQTGNPIPGGTYQTFNLAQLAQTKNCGNLSGAAATALNVTLVPENGMPVSYLTIWPTSQLQPLASTMNSLDGRIKANAAIVPAGVNGNINVFVTNTANVVLDLDGYFNPSGANTLQFYPLPPCRVADTRYTSYPQGLGAPHLSASIPRDFPVLESTCVPQNITPVAYSLNVTAVPYPALGNPLDYLEVWPTGSEPQSPVSTLNNLTGTYVANAAIVTAGTSGEITVYPSNDTDLAIDINGYFATPGPGFNFYPTVPCRVIDTRKIGSGQPFSQTLSPPVNVANGPCAVSSTAQAYVFNATVVPAVYLGYLTLWPDSEDQPVVSTLNAADGWVTSNMAVVPNANGKIDAYASGTTQLVLDISGYFAQ